MRTTSTQCYRAYEASSKKPTNIHSRVSSLFRLRYFAYVFITLLKRFRRRIYRFMALLKRLTRGQQSIGTSIFHTFVYDLYL